MHLYRAVDCCAELTSFLNAATEDFPVALARGDKGSPAGEWEAAQVAAAVRIGCVVLAIGDRSVAVGGKVSGRVIVTGDRNMVQQTGKQSAAARSNSGDRSSRTRGITLIPVESSMVHAVGYDEETRCLEVVFNSGRVYCYEDVPPEVFQGLLEAESKGSYMRACIIDMYSHRRGPCRKR